MLTEVSAKQKHKRAKLLGVFGHPRFLNPPGNIFPGKARFAYDEPTFGRSPAADKADAPPVFPETYRRYIFSVDNDAVSKGEERHEWCYHQLWVSLFTQPRPKPKIEMSPGLVKRADMEFLIPDFPLQEHTFTVPVFPTPGVLVGMQLSEAFGSGVSEVEVLADARVVPSEVETTLRLNGWVVEVHQTLIPTLTQTGHLISAFMTSVNEPEGFGWRVTFATLVPPQEPRRAPVFRSML